jgi:hypothetical protein
MFWINVYLSKIDFFRFLNFWQVLFFQYIELQSLAGCGSVSSDNTKEKMSRWDVFEFVAALYDKNINFPAQLSQRSKRQYLPGRNNH